MLVLLVLKSPLQTNAKTPELLYYNLTPVNPDRITTVQSEIITDKTVKNYNTIKLVDSLYDGKLHSFFN
jgi:hypothetical protein